MNVIEIQVGSNGKRNKIGLIPVSLDWDVLSDETKMVVIKHGLKQYLADASAGVTDRKVAEERIMAKRAKLLSGDFTRTRGEGVSKPDTTESRALKLARDFIREQLKALNAKAEKEQIAEAAKELVESEPQYLAEAKKQLEAEAKMKDGKSEAGANVIANLLAKVGGNT